jgi:death-on-curing family protein
MATKRLTVADLAKAADLDLDETLVRLWDAGIDEVEDPRHVIPNAKITLAQRALSLPTGREIGRAEYWREFFGFSPTEFDEMLARLGIHMRPRAKRLPKGAVAMLRREARNRLGKPPPTAVKVGEQPPPKTPPLVWNPVGPVRKEIRFLSEEEVVGIHEFLAREFANDDDPISPPGIASQELLASACYRPHTAIGDDTKYPTVEMAAAALLHSLALNHAFFNGNKRTALVAMLVFLDENGVQLTCGEREVFRLVLQVAQHSLVSKDAIDLADREVYATAQWIRGNSRRMEIGPERVLKWIRLRRILNAFGCWTEFPGKGNAINIYRVVEVRRGSFLGGRKPIRRNLSAQVHYAGDGTDASRELVGHVRRKLWLDDEHGVDTGTFYAAGRAPALDFIVEYRKTLKRLARL